MRRLNNRVNSISTDSNNDFIVCAKLPTKKKLQVVRKSAVNADHIGLHRNIKVCIFIIISKYECVQIIVRSNLMIV